MLCDCVSVVWLCATARAFIEEQFQQIIMKCQALNTRIKYNYFSGDSTFKQTRHYTNYLTEGVQIQLEQDSRKKSIFWSTSAKVGGRRGGTVPWKVGNKVRTTKTLSTLVKQGLYNSNIIYLGPTRFVQQQHYLPGSNKVCTTATLSTLVQQGPYNSNFIYLGSTRSVQQELYLLWSNKVRTTATLSTVVQQGA